MLRWSSVGWVSPYLGLGRLGLRPADPCIGEVLSGSAVLCFNCAICVSWSELSPPSPWPGSAENGSDYPWVRLSQRMLDPLLRGLGVVDSPTPVGSDGHNM
jgi:hypothetical protein